MRQLWFLFIIANFSCAQTAAPLVVHESLASARALFKQGKFQEAAAAYRVILQQDKSSGPAYAGLVQSYLKLDDVGAAAEASTEAIAELPQSGLVHAIHGDVYFRQGLLEESEAEYKTALKLDDKCARALLGMGRIYSAASLNQQAKDSFAQAHQLDPDDGDAWYHWAVLLPYPDSVAELEKQRAEFHSTPDEQRREREFIDLIKGIAGREVWVGLTDVSVEIKLELLVPRLGVRRGLGARVRFNNSATATLLVDTGASWMTIPAKLAEKIGARKISSYTIEGVGGSEPASGYFAWVDKITVGDVEFHDCVVHVSPKSSVAEDNGVLGTDIFSKYLLAIDFPARKLRLTALPETAVASGEIENPLKAKAMPKGRAFSFGHLLLLPTKVNQATQGLFVLDTGANASSISPGLAKRAGKLRDSDRHVTGSRGEVNKVSILPDAIMEFAQRAAEKRDLVAFDWRSLSQQLGVEVAGFIGFDALSRSKISINYRDGWVKVEQSK